jgi:hypothetical protein
MPGAVNVKIKWTRAGGGGGTAPNYTIALDDWSTGSAVQVGTLTLNVDNGIVTPQDSTLAAHYSGGIQTWRSASSIVHGPAGEQFEFGAMMFTVTNGAFDNTDLYQVLVGCKPYGRWSTYPFSDTFNKSTDITHPAPFKVRILNGAGTLVKTIEMRDGLPVNSASLSQSGRIAGFVPLSQTINNPFTTTAGSNVVVVNHPNHGFNLTAGYYDGYPIYAAVYGGAVPATFDGALGFNGLTAADINGGRRVTLINANSYSFVAGAAASSSGSGGGATYIEWQPVKEDSTSPPLRPFFNCAMLLPWQNKRPKKLATVQQKLPNIDYSTWRPTSVTPRTSSNMPLPMLEAGSPGRTQQNGYNQWRFMLRWPRTVYSILGPLDTNSWHHTVNTLKGPYNGTTFSGSYDPAIAKYQDSYMFLSQATGWGYEPGSISGHTWFTGPGGVRFDRYQFSSVAAQYISSPSSVNLLDNTAIADVADDWGLAYFNHSCHYLTNVKTFEGISASKAELNSNTYINDYYGNYGTAYGAGRIDLVAIANGDYDLGLLSNQAAAPRPASRFYDKYGLTGAKRFWNGWAIDGLHGHQQAGLWSYGFGSPMHMVSAKHLMVAHRLSMNGGTSGASPSSFWNIGTGASPSSRSIISTATTLTTTTYVESDTPAKFSRELSYRWGSLLWMWLNSNASGTNAFGYSKALIEEMFLDDFNAAYTNIVNPVNTNAATSPWCKVFKSFGCGANVTQVGGNYYLVVGLNAVHLYLGQLLIIMKMTGAWDSLRSMSSNSAAVLDFYLHAMFRRCIDIYADNGANFEIPETSAGRAKYSTGRFVNGLAALALPLGVDSFGVSDVPSEWTAVSSTFPKEGSENFFRYPDGTYVEKQGNHHLVYQVAHALRYWFASEVTAFYGNTTKADAAISAYQASYSSYKTNIVDTGIGDFEYSFMPAWRMKTPAEVGL